MRLVIRLLIPIFLVIFVASCKDGSTIGVVGQDDNDSTIFDFPNGKNPPTDGFFFYGKVNGVFHCLIEDTGGYVNVVDSTRLRVCDTMSFKDRQRTRLIRPGDNRFIWQIDYFRCTVDTNDSMLWKVAQYDTAFPPGARPFVDQNENVYEGVEILWTTSEGDAYKSVPGSGTPQNSSFNITNVYTNDEDTLSYKIIEGNYIGTLLNFDGSKSVFVTESQFRMRFIEIPDTLYQHL